MKKFLNKFSIPYNIGFEDTVCDFSDYIFDFYFSDDEYPSARVKSTDISKLKQDIEFAKTKNIKANYVLNSAFYSLDMYSKDNIIKLVNHINSLNLDILTINNMLLLQSKDFMNNINPDIILKNSVNNKVDSVEKAAILYNKFGIKDIIIDRGVNRDQTLMLEILAYCRKNNITSTIMLNEGCMPNCMYKQFCDLNTSIYDMNNKPVGTRERDTTGCNLDYETDPDLVLKSPFFTRSNVLEIIDSVDVLKIAGRNISNTFVSGILEYYLLNNRSLSLYNFVSTQLPEMFKGINFYMLEEYDYSKHVKNCKSLCFSECDQCDKITQSILKTKI